VEGGTQLLCAAVFSAPPDLVALPISGPRVVVGAAAHAAGATAASAAVGAPLTSCCGSGSISHSSENLRRSGCEAEGGHLAGQQLAPSTRY
jgi:hypothetical protein